nr:DUF1778 domain-containing protein [uncultured Neisseria sp.]
MNIEMKKQLESTRVTIRMTKDQYDLLNEGATLSGNQSFNSFMVSSALAEARKLRIEDSFIKSMKEKEVYDLKELNEDAVILNRSEAMSIFQAFHDVGLSNTYLRDLIKEKLKGPINDPQNIRDRELLGI